jgi:gamma-glutamylcyclotransferase (GGCT)/AIG2-like uncharacterized protein YtfP
MTKIFVYGTLKRGHLRAPVLAQQTFIEEVKTLPQYKLFDLGDFPGLMQVENGNAIIGELYEVDETCLKRLDRIEGHPTLYKRDNINLANGEEAVAYFWQGNPGKDIGDSWDGE